MIKKILFLILFAPLSVDIVADRDSDHEADTDRFGTKYGWCAPSKKYGHHAIIVDTTEGFSEAQYSLLQNQILNVKFCCDTESSLDSRSQKALHWKYKYIKYRPN